MKFMIAGAGAMGSRFGLMLHQKGHDVLLIDTWQEHVETINKKGLRVDYNGDKIVEKIPAPTGDRDGRGLHLRRGARCAFALPRLVREALAAVVRRLTAASIAAFRP